MSKAKPIVVYLHRYPPETEALQWPGLRALIAELAMPGYRATIERAMVIDVVGYDWNCPQHIAPRFTEGEVQAAVAPLLDEVRALREEVARLRAASN